MVQVGWEFLAPCLVTFTMDGYVGIGTAAPLTLLSVAPNSTGPKITLWDGGSTTDHYGFTISAGELDYHADGRHVFKYGGKASGTGTELLILETPGASGPGWSLRRGGGNARGLYAVDWQGDRWTATQVASGDYAVIAGGRSNTASGSLSTVGGGYQNTANGFYSTVSGGNINIASNSGSTVGGGYGNTASGLYSTVNGGINNSASGYGSIICGGENNTASGTSSVVLGGTNNTANGNYNLVFGWGVVPSVNEPYRVYLFGPTTSGSGNLGFLVINRFDGDYPIHVGPNTNNGNGAYLTTGGTWTNGSSRTFKERFVQQRPQEVLEKIRQLPVEGYYYKGTEEYHITPMAEDFYRLFRTGVYEILETDSTGRLIRRPNPEVDKYLAASDVAGVGLLGIQALAEENDALKKANAALQARVKGLEVQVEAFRAELEALKARIAEARAEGR